MQRSSKRRWVERNSVNHTVAPSTQGLQLSISRPSELSKTSALALRRSSTTFITAVKKMFKRSGESTYRRRSPCPTPNPSEHSPSVVHNLHAIVEMPISVIDVLENKTSACHWPMNPLRRRRTTTLCNLGSRKARG
ncbi:unnamed protein product, partial [Discosporangium mesarthrocarpum]